MTSNLSYGSEVSHLFTSGCKMYKGGTAPLFNYLRIWKWLLNGQLASLKMGTEVINIKTAMFPKILLNIYLCSELDISTCTDL